MEEIEREAFYVLLGELQFLLSFYSVSDIPRKDIEKCVNDLNTKLNRNEKP